MVLLVFLPPDRLAEGVRVVEEVGRQVGGRLGECRVLPGDSKVWRYVRRHGGSGVYGANMEDAWGLSFFVVVTPRTPREIFADVLRFELYKHLLLREHPVFNRLMGRVYATAERYFPLGDGVDRGKMRTYEFLVDLLENVCLLLRFGEPAIKAYERIIREPRYLVFREEQYGGGRLYIAFTLTILYSTAPLYAVGLYHEGEKSGFAELLEELRQCALETLNGLPRAKIERRLARLTRRIHENDCYEKLAETLRL